MKRRAFEGLQEPVNRSGWRVSDFSFLYAKLSAPTFCTRVYPRVFCLLFVMSLLLAGLELSVLFVSRITWGVKLMKRKKSFK